MNHPNDDTVKALEHDWPNYQVWYVHNVIGPPTWCARRWDGTGHTLNASSSDGLVALLEAEVTP